MFDIVLTYGRPLVAGMAILVRKVCLKAGHFCDPIGLLVDLRLCDYPGGRSMWTRWNCHQCANPLSGTMGVGPQMGCDTTRLYCIKVSTIRGRGDDCILWVSHGETFFFAEDAARKAALRSNSDVCPTLRDHRILVIPTP